MKISLPKPKPFGVGQISVKSKRRWDASRFLKHARDHNCRVCKVDLAKDGLPFDKVILVFSLDRGTVVAKTIAMEGPVLGIGGTGRYEITKDDQDIVLAVSPIGAYANLLKKIPLFKRVTGREGHRLDAAMFSVKGTRRDPAVAYLPLQHLSNTMTGMPGLALDVLENARTLPAQLFAPVPRATEGSQHAE